MSSAAFSFGALRVKGEVNRITDENDEKEKKKYRDKVSP